MNTETQRPTLLAAARGSAAVERKKRQWWAVADGDVREVTGYSCAPSNPDMWWCPELARTVLHNIRSPFAGKAKHGGTRTTISLKSHACLAHKLPLEQNIKMKLRNTHLKLKMPGYMLNGKLAALVKEELQNVGCLFEDAVNWLKALKLLAKLHYLSAKLRVLSIQRRYLLREKRRLLLKQVNHILAESGGAADANNLFSGIECAHSVVRAK